MAGRYFEAGQELDIALSASNAALPDAGLLNRAFPATRSIAPIRPRSVLVASRLWRVNDRRRLGMDRRGDGVRRRRQRRRYRQATKACR
jgi:hypothetical protein